MTAVVPHPRAELERLYSEHAEQVRAICGSILRNRHEAEDAAQQVFVAALRALRGGTVPRDSGAWLATIARRESWARARRSSATALPEELEDRSQEDPATTVVRRAEIAETWQTIADLPASQRRALLLREVRGLGYDELADDLRLTRASVRSLLNRARTTLRMQLDRGAAVFTGAEWVNVLARLFDSASTSPVLPSATRAAAVGLGALAIAGGVVASAPTKTHHQPARPSVQRASSAASPRAATVVTGDSRHDGQRGGGEAPSGGERSGAGTQTSGRDSSGDGLSGETSSSGDSGVSRATSGSDGGQVSSDSGSGDTVTTSGTSSGPSPATSGSDGGTSSGGSSGSGGTSDSASSGGSGTSDSSVTSDTSGSSSGSSDSPDGGS